MGSSPISSFPGGGSGGQRMRRLCGERACPRIALKGYVGRMQRVPASSRWKNRKLKFDGRFVTDGQRDI